MVGEERRGEYVGEGEAGNDESIEKEVSLLVREHSGEEGNWKEKGNVEGHPCEENDENSGALHWQLTLTDL